MNRIEGRIDVTAIETSEAMVREGIHQIRNYRGRFSVQLFDGKAGIGATVGEALRNAKAGQRDLNVVSL